MRSHVEIHFTDFYNKWMCQLQLYLQYLLGALRKGDTKASDYEALVSKLTAHHKAYYTAKWAAAREDVLAFFHPVWLSPLEIASSWVTGWKPSAAFKLIDSVRKTELPGPSLARMTEDQLRMMEQLKVKVKMEEQKVERLMERYQVAMADRHMVELARLATKVKGGRGEVEAVVVKVDGMVEVAMKNVLGGLEDVMKRGDCVRLKTLKGILDLLDPAQSVEFLAATSMLHVQLMKVGKEE